ncbi:MAG: hypothetical protein MN733_17960, partial [Nitrososphaera sp.]|nr:hypothetical protein [Nitrososphaera sp.]
PEIARKAWLVSHLRRQEVQDSYSSGSIKASLSPEFPFSNQLQEDTEWFPFDMKFELRGRCLAVVFYVLHNACLVLFVTLCNNHPSVACSIHGGYAHSEKMLKGRC